MCLAVPGKVISLEGEVAQVEVQGIVTPADVSLLDDVRVGDYVIIHTGFAIQKYDEKEAEETIRLLEECVKRAGLQ